jgi:hypothetical protein
VNYSIKAFISKDGDGYTAECLDVAAKVHGKTLDETVEALRQEICRCLTGADLGMLGLVDDPTLFITFEDVPIPDRPLVCPTQFPMLAEEHFS